MKQLWKMNEYKARYNQINRELRELAWVPENESGFVALQQEKIDLLAKHPELHSADVHRPIRAQDKLK